MLKSRISSCVALIVSAALISPTTVVTASPGQAQAAGSLYTGDCPEALLNAAKFEKGLKTLDDMIARTERQLAGTQNGHLSREAAKQSADAKTDLAGESLASVLAEVHAVKQVLELLGRSTPGTKTGLAILKASAQIKRIEEAYKVLKVPLAQGKWALAREAAHSNMEQVAALARFLDEAGLTGIMATYVASTVVARTAVVGAVGASAVAGVVAGLAVAAGVFAIDGVAAAMDGSQNAADQRQAADTVSALKQNRSVYQDRIDADRSRCAQQPQRAENSRPAKGPPAPAPPPPTPPTASGGPGLGSLLVLGGLGFAGYAGVKYYQQQNQGCLKQGIAALNTYDACFASASASSSACRAFFAEADSCCRQEGQSGYDKSVGACY